MDWERRFSDRATKMKASDIREMFRLTEEPDIISFAGGFPGRESFPIDLLSGLSAKAAAADRAAGLQYGPTEGMGSLRRMIADRMANYGVQAGPDNVLITAGSQQALDLLGRLFLNGDDKVIVEKPGYIGGIGALASYDADLVGVPVDEDGIDVDALGREVEKLIRRREPRPKLAYVVPDFQNPTGACMSRNRREALVALAEEHDFVILEDAPYRELRYDGEPLPTLKSMDAHGRVVFLGSFSKVFAPGVRIAYVVADAPVVQKLGVIKQSADLCTGTLGQQIVLQAGRDGVLDENVRKLRQLYAARRNAMVRALRSEFRDVGGVAWTEPSGGFFAWLSLPERVDAKALLPEAIRRGVAYVGGEGFHADGSGQNTIRLSFSQVAPQDIAEGMRRLGALMREAIGAAATRTGGESSMRPNSNTY